ncbi:hypothetical protein T492DRAFT_263044 [Pavlovales sp. CCMP2436]|nr:hypothetical protein T492DRAFT_263044 [Pavlovales sp. CCMP2436]
MTTTMTGTVGVQGVESGKGEKVGKEAASELEARRARYVSKSRQLKSLGKKDRAKETALKMKMFERTVQDKSSALLSSEGGLAPPAKLMAEGSADDYVMTDPLTEQGGESAADSRLQSGRGSSSSPCARTRSGPSWSGGSDTSLSVDSSWAQIGLKVSRL